MKKIEESFAGVKFEPNIGIMLKKEQKMEKVNSTHHLTKDTKRRIGRFMLIICFILLLGVGCASAATLVVNKTFPACTHSNFYCDTVQEAVNMANDGDTIAVYEGIYPENVVIDKPLVLKASGKVTIEAPDSVNPAVWIKGNNVILSGFKAKEGFAGILLDNVRECIIENNSVFGNKFGICLITSRDNSILNNSVFKNGDTGIFLQDSSKNIIRNNTANENGDTGIYLIDSSRNEICNNIVNKNFVGIVLIEPNINERWFFRGFNKIKENIICKNKENGIGLEHSFENEVNNNTINNNGEYGIYLIESLENKVTDNIVNKNLNGFVLIESNKNIIKSNTACENGYYGIYLEDSSNNEVSNNKVNKNLDAITLIESDNNTIENNIACENGDDGIYLEDSSDNEVSNNIVNKNLYGFLLAESINNKIQNNTAYENQERGIQLQDSSENVISNNIFNKNFGGILLSRANNNKIRKNSAYENQKSGIQLQESLKNEVSNNIISKNFGGFILLKSNYNIITNNNIVDNVDQVVIGTAYLNEFNYNFWSDYEGKDDDKDGIGDEPYKIEGIKDPYPYMNYSGWLNVVITPEFWYFFAKRGDVTNKTFRIENSLNEAIKVDFLLDDDLKFEEYSDLNPGGNKNNNKTFYILPKSTKSITLRLNTTNLEGYILRKIIIKTEEYTKTTLVYGFAQPKIYKTLNNYGVCA